MGIFPRNSTPVRIPAEVGHTDHADLYRFPCSSATPFAEPPARRGQAKNFAKRLRGEKPRAAAPAARSNQGTLRTSCTDASVPHVAAPS